MKINAYLIYLSIIFSVPLAILAMEKPQGQPNEKLLVAAKKRDLQGIIAALDAGANPNYCKTSYLECESPALFQVLHPRPGDELNKDEVQSNLIAIVDLLLKRGAQVNYIYTKDYTKITPLHEAVASNLETVVEFLLDHGANVNPQGVDYSPLHRANGEIGRLLLSRGADIESRARLLGNTPLHDAMFELNIPLIKVLLDHGVDINALNSAKRSSLDEMMENSLSRGSLWVAVRLFLMHGCKISKDASIFEHLSRELNDLESAIIFGTIEGVKKLLEDDQMEKLGRVVENEDNFKKELYYQTKGQHLEYALTLAVGQGKVEVVRLLLEKGANQSAALFCIKNIFSRLEKHKGSAEELENYLCIRQLLLNQPVLKEAANSSFASWTENGRISIALSFAPQTDVLDLVLSHATGKAVWRNCSTLRVNGKKSERRMACHP
jgi:ankyrin repeat protein